MGIQGYLIVSTILFGLGAFGFMARRNAILMLISIELMFNAVNLSLVAFNAFLPPDTNAGAVFALMIMAVAAAITPPRQPPEVDQYPPLKEWGRADGAADRPHPRAAARRLPVRRPGR